MNITIDKNYTICGALKPLKEYAKEFKKRYTEGDLMAVVETYGGEVLKCEVEMWCPVNPVFGMDDTDVSVRVLLWLDAWDTVKKVVYYCNGALTLSENIDVDYTMFKRSDL